MINITRKIHPDRPYIYNSIKSYYTATRMFILWEALSNVLWPIMSWGIRTPLHIQITKDDS